MSIFCCDLLLNLYLLHIKYTITVYEDGNDNCSAMMQKIALTYKQKQQPCVKAAAFM